MQAEEHPLIPTAEFRTVEEYVLYLIHLVAYQEGAKFAAGKTALDIGCNNGYGTALLGRAAKNVVGVDVSPRGIATARRQHATGNVDFRVVDGSSLPFDDESFDLVVSFQVIEHVFNTSDYLSEIRRVLTRSGIAIFTTPNARIRIDPGMKPWNPFHVREFSASELKSLLAPWFPSVAVQGLFADPEVYDIEFQRLQRARTNARRQQELERRVSTKARRLIKIVAKALLPSAAWDALRSALQAESHSEPASAVLEPAILARYSTHNFFYGGDDPDTALDLMAICTSSRRL